MTSSRFRMVCFVFVFAAFGCATIAAEPLRLNTEISEHITADEPLEYQFTATGPGGVAVLLRCEQGIDIYINLVDPSGQVTTYGQLDGDWYSNEGSEQGVLTINEAGEHTLRILAAEGEGDIDFVVSVLKLGAAEMPNDPHSRPQDAIDMKMGQWASESIRPLRGDWRDWFRFTAERDGTVTLLLRGESVDLVLCLYSADDFVNTLDWTDEGEGSESLTADVKAGRTYYIRITSRNDEAGDYKLLAGYVGGTAEE